MTPSAWDWQANGRDLCRECGDKRDKHRCLDGACPPKGKPFPRFPESALDPASDTAQAKWGERLAAYWGAGPGTQFTKAATSFPRGAR